MSVTISGQFIADKKHIWVGLTAIYGIGKTTALGICQRTGIPSDKRVSDLTEGELDQIRQEISHLTVEGELRREVAINIKQMMDLGSYKGIRHRRGLPVNGQRTKTNAKTRKRRKRN
ncbi:MAG: 30S ribosomal protein S13 [Legionellales bacterium]|jgi:small subunit ribosomal protein S13|nr:30S ribosomal protein S13 [Legionellales bacterium]|tara:strand:+ start:2390 stop:2740 length:351 start_codon:yes stop_codon:yes gene_type:complete